MADGSCCWIAADELDQQPTCFLQQRLSHSPPDCMTRVGSPSHPVSFVRAAPGASSHSHASVTPSWMLSSAALLAVLNVATGGQKTAVSWHVAACWARMAVTS